MRRKQPTKRWRSNDAKYHWKVARRQKRHVVLALRWYRMVDRPWKRLWLSFKATHTLMSGLVFRGQKGFTRAQTVQLLLTSVATELVVLCMLYSGSSGDGPLVINPVKIAVSGCIAALIVIPLMFVAGWLFNPIIFVRLVLALLRLFFCLPCACYRVVVHGSGAPSPKRVSPGRLDKSEDVAEAARLELRHGDCACDGEDANGLWAAPRPGPSDAPLPPNAAARSLGVPQRKWRRSWGGPPKVMPSVTSGTQEGHRARVQASPQPGHRSRVREPAASPEHLSDRVHAFSPPPSPPTTERCAERSNDRSSISSTVGLMEEGGDLQEGSVSSTRLMMRPSLRHEPSFEDDSIPSIPELGGAAASAGINSTESKARKYSYASLDEHMLALSLRRSWERRDWSRVRPAGSAVLQQVPSLLVAKHRR